MPDNTSRKKLPSQADNQKPLTVVRTADNLPAVLTDHGQLAADLTRLKDAIERVEYPSGRYIYNPVEANANSVAALSALLPSIPTLRARWATQDHPASMKELSGIIWQTVECKAAPGVNKEVLAASLCDDIAELHPTAFELQRACRAVRTEHRFLDIVDLIAEIEKAQKRSKQYRAMLSSEEKLKELLCRQADDEAEGGDDE